nr:cytochrome P450 71A8-like [Coffea arabica]
MAALEFTTKTSSKNLPPSPRKLPVLGHMHLLGTHPHRSLQKLAQKHGPMMMLQLGSVKTLVVSSAEAAQEIMKTHDLNFLNRPESEINRKLLYDFKNVSVAPYGEYWRQMKSISVLQLLSNTRVQSIRYIREEETDLLLTKIRGGSVAAPSSGVNLSEMFMALTSDVVSRAAFGRKYSEGVSGRKFRKLMSEFVSVLGGFDFGTFLPWLGWVDRVNGLTARVERIAKEMDEFLEGVIEEHLNGDRKNNESSEQKSREDFADVLLGIRNNNVAGIPIDRDSIKALLLDIFSGGTDTTYTVLEWAMTELLKHPKAMKDLQTEVRGIVSDRLEIDDDDLEKMKYLKAVIKETLRLHPPIPLLVPRNASNDAKIMDYDISAGTMIITNAFAIGRDPSLWEEPDEFKPERFLSSCIDFTGHDFHLIPFGAGRRGCPGISFAMATNEHVLANLLLKFDWDLPDGAKGSDLDMTECTGLTIHRKIPLLAVATPV